MATETLKAWVLHKSPTGDTSARVTFFTLEKGLITCFYKGGRSPKKQAFLQPFLPLWLAIDGRNGNYFVRHVEAVTTLALTGQSLFAGLYINELLYYALSPTDTQPELFSSYITTIHGLVNLNDRLAIEILLRRFEQNLLFACGYAVSFTQEAYSSAAIVENQRYQFVPAEGFIKADSGMSGCEILALAQGKLTTLHELKTAKFIMRQAIDHLLGGKVLKSRLLYPRKQP